MTRQNKAAIALFILGVVPPCVGVAQGDYRDAFQKAVRVCLECTEIG